MRHSLSKRSSERHHAKRRARERFGVLLGKRLRREIIATIQSGAGRFYDRQSCRISRFLFDICGREAIVVYDRARKEIVTVFPYEYILKEERNGNRKSTGVGIEEHEKNQGETGGRPGLPLRSDSARAAAAGGDGKDDVYLRGLRPRVPANEAHSTASTADA